MIPMGLETTEGPCLHSTGEYLCPRGLSATNAVLGIGDCVWSIMSQEQPESSWEVSVRGNHQ